MTLLALRHGSKPAQKCSLIPWRRWAAPGAIVATFSGPRPARWWIRRLLHETTVHRAGAALAMREPFELGPEVAADGIDESLGGAC
jgi:hypothetical protein